VSRLFAEEPAEAEPVVAAAAGSNDLTAAAAAAVARAGGGVAATVKPAASGAARRRSATGAPMRRDARILLVEDNEVNQAVATEMLGELGLEVTIAANGAEAVEAVRKQAFDLVLMDCQMPVLDGYEATAQIRHMEGNARHTVIVALTAHAIGDSREISLAAGMDDFLPKPVTVEALMETLERWLTPTPMTPAARTATLRMPPISQPDTGVIEDRARAASGPAVLLDPAVTRKRRFVEIFLQLAPRDVERIVSAHDAGALSAGAHRLKGSAFALGLRQLALTCEELERLGASNDLAAAGGIVRRLTSELDATCRALEAELAGQRN
jgi:CheY-like chemotaxis protein